MNATNYASLITFLVGGGSILFTRHCNTTQPTTEGDRSRRPTLKGKLQSDEMRKWIKANCPPVSLVISSDTQRTMETVTDADWPKVITTPALYPSLDEILDRMYRHMGNAALNQYQTEETAAPLGKWNREALLSINSIFQEHRPSGDTTALLCGHAIFLLSLLFALVRAIEPDANVNLLLNQVMGECCALRLRMRCNKLKITYHSLEDMRTA